MAKQVKNESIVSDEVKKRTIQWSVVHGDKIICAEDTFDKLEAGYYTLGYSQNIGMYFTKQKIELNKLYKMPNEASDIILNDVSKFWGLEEVYKKYNRVFRRNYLLYSAPGTGKTSLINLMCQDLIDKYNGIVISLTCKSDLEMYLDAVRRIRNIEPKRKIITIIEDLDAYVNSYGDLNSYLLNILDGNQKASGIVTIATTNYIDRIDARYKNRPSRFDRVIEFPLPNDESRKMFIEKSVLEEDLKKIDINSWVKKTKGFTIDHINELILLFFVFGHSEEESFTTIKKMVEENNNLRNEKSENRGRGIGFDCDEDETEEDACINECVNGENCEVLDDDYYGHPVEPTEIVPRPIKISPKHYRD